MNIDYSIQFFLESGAKKSQLLVGLATYGRGFELTDPNNNGIYAAASNGIQAAPYTNALGYWGYNEICNTVLLDSEIGDWTIVRDEYIEAPYAVKGRDWIGYDDEESINFIILSYN